MTPEQKSIKMTDREQRLFMAMKIIQKAVLDHAIKGEGQTFSDKAEKALADLYAGAQIDLIREQRDKELDIIEARAKMEKPLHDLLGNMLNK